MYKKLDVWIKSMELVDQIYEAIDLFPKNEIYSLSDQIKRAAISIPCNIAEGMTRKSDKEKSHFLNISRASASEVETLLIIAHKRKYLQSIENGISLINDIRSMLYRLEERLSDSGQRTPDNGPPTPDIGQRFSDNRKRGD
jgi:four helix bundle protein